MERQKFENDFKDAFNQAEVGPSDGLWTGIELDLEKADGGKMKRKLLVYKLMAAASFSFAMGVAATYFYMSGGNVNGSHDVAMIKDASGTSAVTSENSSVKKQNNASGQQSNSSPSGDTNTTENIKSKPNNVLAENAENSLTQNVLDRRNKTENITTTTVDSRFSKTNDIQQVNSSKEIMISESDNAVPDGSIHSVQNGQVIASLRETKDDDIFSADKKLPAIVAVRKPELVLPYATPVDPVALMMAKLEQREKELMNEDKPSAKKKSQRSERLWTSIGFAAGSFSNPQHTSGNGVTAATTSLAANGFDASTSVANNESKASGTSYSMGLNLGTKISDRWIVQGGVNYLTQNSSYQANGVIGSSDFSSFRAASIAQLNAASTTSKSDKYVSTSPYSVNNSMQFVSIPVQAGYMAINHKVGLQINAGVSTDLFLQNTIAPQGGSLEKSTQGRGSDSPYRPVNFSGLMGTELSYKFGEHYRVALNPGVRYPFSSQYKAGVGVSSTPLTMDVGLRFRYIFR